MKQTIFYIVVVALLTLIWLTPRGGESLLLSGAGFNYYNSASSTSQLVGTTSTLVMTALGREQWICGSGPNDAFVSFAIAASTSTTGTGLMVASSTDCVGPFHFTGDINAATKSGTANVSVTDFR